MNFLGIDYGTKRIGLSTGDDELNFAVPIGHVAVTTIEAAAEEIIEIAKARNIHKMVIGYPFNMDDSIGPKAREVDRFIKILKHLMAIPIERIDERLTSEGVGDLQKSRSPKNRRNLRKKGTIDSAAAVIILQDYLDSLC